MAPVITRLASARVRVTRSILSGQELTRMLALIRAASRPGRANTTTAKCGTAISLGPGPLPAHAHAGGERMGAVLAGDVAVVAEIDRCAVSHRGVGREAHHRAVTR